MRRAIAVAGGGLAGWGPGVGLSSLLTWRYDVLAIESITKFQGQGDSPNGSIVLAGIFLGIGIGLLVAATIRDQVTSGDTGRSHQ
jgi:hypothetical protein